MAIDMKEARAALARWNKELNRIPDEKSGSASTFQNQVLKEDPDGLIIHGSRDNELLALALAIIEASDEVSPAILASLKIRITKARDYNGGSVMLKDYFPFGLKSYVQEINKKSLRLVSLSSDERVPNHESVEDTLVDMINYCCFAIEDDRL